MSAAEPSRTKRSVLWADRAWEDYIWWQEQDRKTLRKINNLLKSIQRDGALAGEGHPEKLLDPLSGCFSRRIDEKNRLLYRMHEDVIEIIQCRTHYGDK